MRPNDPHASAEGAEDRPQAPDAVEPEGEPGSPPSGPVPPPKRGLEILHLDELREDDDEFDDDEDDEDDVEDLEDEDEPIFDEDDDGVRSVLITGANGNIGKKLREAWVEVYDLVLIDQKPDPDDPEVVEADLSVLNENWFTQFHGVDTVIHLAANPDADATWEDLEKPNLDALCNVFHAATLAGVERLIFASSNHVMGGYKEFPDMRITEDLPPKPDGPYGGAKLMGERLGRSLAKAYDITFIAVRLGWVQPGENDPDDMPDDWSLRPLALQPRHGPPVRVCCGGRAGRDQLRRGERHVEQRRHAMGHHRRRRAARVFAGGRCVRGGALRPDLALLLRLRLLDELIHRSGCRQRGDFPARAGRGCGTDVGSEEGDHATCRVVEGRAVEAVTLAFVDA